jgi:hypothetical protein
MLATLDPIIQRDNPLKEALILILRKGIFAKYVFNIFFWHLWWGTNILWHLRATEGRQIAVYGFLLLINSIKNGSSLPTATSSSATDASVLEILGMWVSDHDIRIYLSSTPPSPYLYRSAEAMFQPTAWNPITGIWKPRKDSEWAAWTSQRYTRHASASGTYHVKSIQQTCQLTCFARLHFACSSSKNTLWSIRQPLTLCCWTSASSSQAREEMCI